MGVEPVKSKTIIRSDLTSRLEFLNRGTPNERICSAFVKPSNSNGIESLLVCLYYRTIEYIGGQLLHGKADCLGPEHKPAIRDGTCARTPASAGIDLGWGSIVEIGHGQHMVSADANYI
jgi:hypothetical protein